MEKKKVTVNGHFLEEIHHSIGLLYIFFFPFPSPQLMTLVGDFFLVKEHQIKVYHLGRNMEHKKFVKGQYIFSKKSELVRINCEG